MNLIAQFDWRSEKPSSPANLWRSGGIHWHLGQNLAIFGPNLLKFVEFAPTAGTQKLDTSGEISPSQC